MAIDRRNRPLEPLFKELADEELDQLIKVPPLNWREHTPVLRYVDASLSEGSSVSLCKAFIMLRNTARCGPGLLTATKPNFIKLCQTHLETSADSLVRACAASCFAALASTAAGREHLLKKPCKLVAWIINWLKVSFTQGRDGWDVHLSLNALGSCCLANELREELVTVGAVELCVGVLQSSLPLLLLGQSKAGLQLTSGPYAAHPPMQHACYAAVGLLLNLLPAETARMQITKTGLPAFLESVITVVSSYPSNGPPSSLLARTQLLAAGLGVHHVMGCVSSQRANEVASRREAALLRAERDAARGLLATRTSPTRSRGVAAAMAEPLAPSLQLAVETLQEQRKGAKATARRPTRKQSSPGAGALTTVPATSTSPVTPTQPSRPHSRATESTQQQPTVPTTTLATQPSRASRPHSRASEPVQPPVQDAVVCEAEEVDVGQLEGLYGGEGVDVSGLVPRRSSSQRRHHRHRSKHRDAHGGGGNECATPADGSTQEAAQGEDGRRRHRRHRHRHRHREKTDEGVDGQQGGEDTSRAVWVR